jgi:beta propeller repeat protein
MKIDTKMHSIALVSVVPILFLVLVSSTASAASPTITKTQITTHRTAENPAIYGNIIAWQDYRNGNWDIYIYNISTKKETHTTNKLNQTNPAIYSNRVVWEDYRNGNADIYMQDIFTNKQTRITTNKLDQYSPAIYGDKIVWVDGRNGGKLDNYGYPVRDEGGNPIGKLDIYMYDLSTQKETRITSSGSAYKPDIYGDKIVYTDYRGTGGIFSRSNIYIYDLANKKETKITASGDAYDPAIYGNRIVWAIWEDAPIHMYDLSTRKETQITSSGRAYNPDIYGDMIVYEDSRYDATGNTDIFMYDLSTKEETMITPWDENRGEEQDDPYQVNPAIYGNKIVYADGVYQPNDVHGNIYMSTLSYLPVASFAAFPISGKTPLIVKFTDKSTGLPTSWYWNFGDKSSSTARNPTHKYTKAGKYTVTLTVKNAAGSNNKKITNYVTIK